jgi:NAD(P)-dependent dehydrogenase (short-subunit alcohol dehydrogenase family)
MLKNSRVVITGAAGTLGQAAAKVAKEKGATTIGLDIVAADSLPHLDRYHQVDLLNRESTSTCIANIGNFDALINIAGGFAMGLEVAEPSDEQWDWMFQINVQTLRNVMISSVPMLKAQGGGKVVNIGALGAASGGGAMSAYCCAKSSVMRLTESLSEELKGDGINVNAVLPSIIDTPPNREAMPDADFAQWVDPEKLAQVICFLASDEATAIHGALLPVKGLV